MFHNFSTPNLEHTPHDASIMRSTQIKPQASAAALAAPAARPMPVRSDPIRRSSRHALAHTHTPGLRPCARTSSHKNKKNFPTDTDRPDDDHQPPSWGRPHPHHCQQHRRTKTHSDSETIQTSYQKSIQIHIKTNSKQLTHIDAAAAAAARAAAAGVTRREEWNESDRDRPWQIEYISQTPGVLAQDTISEFEGQPPAGPVHWHALAGCRLPGRAALEAAKKACHHVVENMLLPR